MELSQLEQNDVVILKLSGKLMGGPDATAVNDKLHELVEKGQTKVVADLSNVEWMNSSGLGILISGLTTLQNQGGSLKLACVSENIQKLLTITKLDRVLTPYDSVENAVNSF